MHPLLFTSDYLSMPTYGLFYLAAFLACIFMAAHLASRVGVPFWRMVDIAFMFTIAGEVGARLTFVITEWPRFRDGAISFKQFLVAGRVVLGGIVVGIGAAIWLFRRYRLPLLAVLDASTPGVALGMGIGRLGCLMSGCCYGKPTGLAWGITFTDPVAKAINGTPLGESLHPTQIIQALDGFLLFAILFFVFGRRKFDGQVIALYLLLAGTSRFFVEFLRGDDRGEALGLATSQWLGLVMIAAGILLWTMLGRRLRQARGA